MTGGPSHEDAGLVGPWADDTAGQPGEHTSDTTRTSGEQRAERSGAAAHAQRHLHLAFMCGMR